jgi:hypothetical protein
MERFVMYDEFYEVFLPQPEIWKPVVGYEGSYEVSNYGVVKSIDRLVTYQQRGASVTRLFEGRVLRPKYDKDGYESYVLSSDGDRKALRGHRIIALSFLKGGSQDLVVDHKDAEVTHNFVWNLQWMTNTENTIKHYGKDAGLGKSLSSLTIYEWYYIGYLFNEGLEYTDICENLGLDVKRPDTIWDVLSGRRLSSVTGFKEGDFLIRKHPKTKLMDIEDVVEIIKERKLRNKSLKDISKMYAISESMVSRYVNGIRQPEALAKFKEKYGV